MWEFIAVWYHRSIPAPRVGNGFFVVLAFSLVLLTSGGVIGRSILRTQCLPISRVLALSLSFLRVPRSPYCHVISTAGGGVVGRSGLCTFSLSISRVLAFSLVLSCARATKLLTIGYISQPHFCHASERQTASTVLCTREIWRFCNRNRDYVYALAFSAHRAKREWIPNPNVQSA